MIMRITINTKILLITKKMKKIDFLISGEYREFEKLKISYLLIVNSSFYYLH